MSTYVPHMRKHTLVLAAIMALIVSLAAPASGVIGGSLVSPAPGWAAFLTVQVPRGWDPDTPEAYDSHCSGALISPQWVVTAAHCVAKIPPSGGYQVLEARRVQVELGRTNGGQRGTTFKVDRIEMQNYRAVSVGLDDDIALLHLTKSSTAQPLWVLPSFWGAVQPGNAMTLYGYGHTVGVNDPGYGADRLGILRRTTTNANNLYVNCVAQSDGRSCIRDSFDSFGAGGDSGGPWVAEIDGSPVLTVVFSGYVRDGSEGWAYGEAIGDADTGSWLRTTAGIPNLYGGIIVRDPTNGAAWMIDLHGFRRPIADGSTYQCLVRDGRPVVELPMQSINLIPARSRSALCKPPTPTEFTVHRTSGPAGFVSDTAGITCPDSTFGTVYVLGRGAGVIGYNSYGHYAWPYITMSVGSHPGTEPGTYEANVYCAESTENPPVNYTITRTHTFQQTITRPASTLEITPAMVPPGGTMTVGDGEGCGPHAFPPQAAQVMVWDDQGGGYPVIRRVVPVDAEGRWSPVTFVLPDVNTTSWGVYVSCEPEMPDPIESSRYSYGTTWVPAS